MTIINTTDDLLRALDEQPAWRESVRARILGEEVLNLPAIFSAFVEQVTQFVAEQREFSAEQRQFNTEQREFVAEQRQINAEQQQFNAEQRQINTEQQQFNAEQRQFNAEQREFVAEQRQINAEQRQFNAEQRQINAEQQQFNAEQREFVAEQQQFNAEQREFVAEQQQFNQRIESRVAGLEEFNQEQRRVNERIERRVTRIDQDIGRVRGYYANIRTKEHAPLIAYDMGLNFVTRLDMVTLVQYCQSPELSYASREQLRSFLRADLLMAAHDGGKPVLLAVEVSYTADRRDTDRAIRNAHYLTQATGEVARAVVASVRNDHEAQELIDLGVVYWHKLLPEMLEAD